jgi:hypothetical protein
MRIVPETTVHAKRTHDGAAMSNLEEFREMGPIDWLLIEFDGPWSATRLRRSSISSSAD